MEEENLKEILSLVNQELDESQVLFAGIKENNEEKRIEVAVLLGKVEAFRVVIEKIHEIASRVYH